MMVLHIFLSPLNQHIQLRLERSQFLEWPDSRHSEAFFQEGLGFSKVLQLYCFVQQVNHLQMEIAMEE